MKIQTLNDVIDAFEKLQIKHEALIKGGIESIRDKTNDVPDLDIMTDDREQAFRNLQNAFGDMAVVEGDLEGLEGLRQRLSRVLEREDVIKKRVEEYRAGLKESLDRMNHGKKALKGYGSSGF
ncbi:flagellar protein FliT [Desulforegula conservatrix]|uniref:flagellar protein FliT n=1 Tax=Desulforegula conservatrix TaxID=153026 RepID=UPI0004248E95|nr:flagellar protein FliT [Desulforegula conservatrix]